MVVQQVRRLNKCRTLEQIQVVTSCEKTDDEVERVLRKTGISVFRGAEDDVLDRFYQSSIPMQPGHVVRLTGDCPLIDPAVVDQIVEYHLAHDLDYTSNVDPPTWPDGLDVEVMRFSVLEEAWQIAEERFDREHVTPFIHKNKDRYRCGNVVNPRGDQSGMRWTVDEPEDYELVKAIYEDLHAECPEFGTEGILKWLSKNPDWAAINSHHQRNAQCTERVDG